MDIHNLDCFEYFKKVADNSINLFVLDLPYTTTNWGKTTACKWDTPIDLEKMWKEIKRIMKRNAIIIFFCNTKFGFNLIQSNQKWFKYDLIWKKSRKVGFLCANKMPLRQHENIYIFKKEGNGTYNSQLEEGEPYKIEGKGNKIITTCGVKERSTIDNKGTRHPTSVLEMEEDSENIYVFKKESGTYNSQMEEGEPHNRHKYKGDNRTKTYYNVALPFNVKENKGTRHPTSVLEMGEDSENIYIFKKKGETETYNPQKEEGVAFYKSATTKQSGKEQEDYNGSKIKYTPQTDGTLRHPTSILEELDELDNNTCCYVFKKEGGTYNSQKEEGLTPYVDKRTHTQKLGTYGEKTLYPQNNNGMFHPTNILEYDNPSKSIHKTQKPTDLLEWLIKSYSNEGDLVCDFTFGSGSTAIACLNTKRRFTGCERDTDIFKTAKKRIDEHDTEQYLLQEEERKQKKIRTKIREYKKFIEKHTNKKDNSSKKKKNKNKECV